MKLNKYDIDYPRDIFNSLIDGNSPYAFYLFQWVLYQTDAKLWRLKMCHDVKTFDGREAFGIWPNADSCGPFKDHEVEFIRISKEQHGSEWEDTRPNQSNAPDSAKDAELLQTIRKSLVEIISRNDRFGGDSYIASMADNAIEAIDAAMAKKPT